MSQNSPELVLFSNDALLGDLLSAHFNEAGRWKIRVSGEGVLPECPAASFVLVDFRSSEGLGVDFVKLVLSRWQDARCMVLSNGFSESLVRLFRRVQVAGLFDKKAGLSTLRDALGLFVNGGFYLSPGLDKHWSSEDSPSVRDLTNREVEILTLVSKGMKSPEISRRLSLSVKTVHNHRANMMRKVGVRNVAQLVNYAHQHNLVSRS